MLLSPKSKKILDQLAGTSILGDLRKLAKEIKKDHTLAMELWNTGKFLPRMLAVLIMDNKVLTQELIDTLGTDMQAHPIKEREQLIDWLMANQLTKDKQSFIQIELVLTSLAITTYKFVTCHCHLINW